jgi:hypothetical protein
MTTCTYIGTGPRCTCTALEGKSYCADHYAVVYKVGSGRQRKKDTLKAARVRLVIQLFYEACDILEAEGFDLYGDEILPDADFDSNLELEGT